MFVTNWNSTTKIQKISEITNFFRHYFLSRTEVEILSTPLSPSCEEGVLNPLPSPRPFQKDEGCNSYAIKEIFPNHPVPPS